MYTDLPDVERVVRLAYKGECPDISVPSCVTFVGKDFKTYRPSPDRQDDAIAQSALRIAFIRRCLTSPYRRVLEAYYRRSNSHEVANLKALDCRHLSAVIDIGDPQYRLAVIFHWAGLAHRPRDTQWAETCGVDRQTLYRWRKGWKGKPGIKQELEKMRIDALSALRAPFYEMGLL